MEGNFPAGFLGVHAAGHFTMLGRDLIVPLDDTTFCLNYALIDVTIWIWRALNIPSSLTDAAGTLTFFNDPPNANAKLSDITITGLLAGEIPLGVIQNTLGGLLGSIYLGTIKKC